MKKILVFLLLTLAFLTLNFTSHAQFLPKTKCAMSGANTNADLYNTLFKGIQRYRAAGMHKRYQQELIKLVPIKRRFEWSLANVAAVYIGHQFKLSPGSACFGVFFRYFYKKNITISHYDEGKETYYTIKDVNDGRLYFDNASRWEVLSRLFLKDAGMARLLQPDDRVAEAIIIYEVENYSGPCPCPYNTDANGYQCGQRSAWSRSGGKKPLCYKKDIPISHMNSYRYHWLRGILS